jgi:hypothetical protein
MQREVIVAQKEMIDPKKKKKKHKKTQCKTTKNKQDEAQA